jgi:NitT/TauT family transport system substrate-binding protein
MIPRILSGCLFLLAVYVSSPLAAAQEAKKLKKIRVAVPSRSFGFLPLSVAEKKGFFAQEGLALEMVLMRPTISTQALVAGEIDFDTVSTRDIAAALNGLPVRIVMALDVGPTQTLIVKPGIRTMKDLKGKTLGVGGPKTLTDVLIRKALQKFGFVPDVDVKLVPLGGGGSEVRLAALLAGKVDGTMLSPPHSTIVLTRHGFVGLLEAKDVSGVLSANLATTTTAMKNSPAAIIGAIKATLRGARFFRENKGEFIHLLAQETGIKETDMAERIYKEFLALASPTGIASDAAMRESLLFVQESLGIAKEASVSDIADWSFAQRALEELKTR